MNLRFRSSRLFVSYSACSIGALMASVLLLAGCLDVPTRRALDLELPPQSVSQGESTNDPKPRAVEATVPARRRGYSEEDWSLTVSIGESTAPDTTVLSVIGNYYLSDDMSVGPSVQYGTDDNQYFIAASALVKKYLEFKKIDGLKAYPQGGGGIIYFAKDAGGATEEDWGLLLNVGGGLDYEIEDDIAIGTSLIYNIIPGDVLGKTNFWTWQIVTFTFKL